MESVSLAGKTVVVTGANIGIGKETARELAKRGGRVILACRSVQRAEEARDDIVKSTGNDNVIVMTLDLASQSSIRQFAEEFNRNETRLDLLVNNAGLVLQERTLTEDGFETHFGVNHLGPFLLTNLLLEKLKSSTPSRVVVVSSEAHEYESLDFDDLQMSRKWSGFKAYCRSKTANVLFSVHLAKIIEGTGVTVYCVHPGFVKSALGRDVQDSCFFKLFVCYWKCCRGRPLSTEEGARTSLYCCLEPSIAHESGLYYSESRQKRAKPYATDPELAERLWTISAELCKLSTTSPTELTIAE